MLIVRGLVGGLFQVAVIAACLLLPTRWIGGDAWSWSRALIYLGVYGVLLGGSVVTLGVFAPASLEARVKRPTSGTQPMADRIVTGLIGLTTFGFFAFIPLDVFRFQLLPTPASAVSALGLALFAVGFLICIVAIYQNSFAVPIVEDQTDAGQVLVDSGLYSVVRHPLYFGILPFLFGTALWLESYASLVVAGLVVLALIARIVVEEGVLRETLPGYIEYSERVRHRLVPFIW